MWSRSSGVLYCSTAGSFFTKSAPQIDAEWPSPFGFWDHHHDHRSRRMSCHVFAGPSTGELSGNKFRCHPIPRRLRNRQRHLRQLYLVQLAPKNTQNGVRVRKLRPLTHPALTVLPWYCNKPFTTAGESMNLGCAGASKAQERVQNLAHGHPRGVGCSLTVVVLSLVHAGSLGG